MPFFVTVPQKDSEQEDRQENQYIDMKDIKELFKIIDHQCWVPHMADDTNDYTLSGSLKDLSSYPNNFQSTERTLYSLQRENE